MKVIGLVLCFILSLNASFAEDGLTVVAVGEAGIQKEKILFSVNKESDSLTVSQKLMVKEFRELLENDFKFYKNVFNVIASEKHVRSLTGVKGLEQLKSKAIQYYTQLNISSAGEGIAYDIKSYRVSSAKELVSRRGVISKSNLRSEGHKVASAIYESILNKKPIFHSKILFVSDRTGTKKKPVKELYIMDFDGKNKKQLTRHGGTIISPAISSDGNRVLYSLISSTKSKSRNINLRLLDIRTNKDTLISSRKGINSGAIFTPDEQSIILTLSHTGNAELYRMNLKTKRLYRLTRNYAPDVDPSLTPDGAQMAFLSGRSGAAMIYTMNPANLEKNVKRISYVGKYNATPRYSPDGKEIVFSSWLDKRFDLFRISSTGTNLSRLTKDFGSNEDPTYSPDGEFIAFSNQRVLSRYKADHKVYIMDRNGEIIGSLTDNYGNCITPRWSK